MAILSQIFLTDSIKFLSKFRLPFFFFLQKLLANFKIYVEIQGIQNSQNNCEKGTKLKDSHFNFETYYKSNIIMPVWYCRKDTYTEHWTRIKSPEINLCIYAHRLFNKIKQLNGARIILLRSIAGATR